MLRLGEKLQSIVRLITLNLLKFKQVRSMGKKHMEDKDLFSEIIITGKKNIKKIQYFSML